MPLKNVFFKFPALIVCMTKINNTKDVQMIVQPRAHEKKTFVKVSRCKPSLQPTSF